MPSGFRTDDKMNIMTRYLILKPNVKGTVTKHLSSEQMKIYKDRVKKLICIQQKLLLHRESFSIIFTKKLQIYCFDNSLTKLSC